MNSNANQPTVRGLAWKRYSRQTPLRDVVPALNGPASPAGARPCRTAAASFMVHVTVKHIHQQVNITEGGQAVVAGDKVTSGENER